MQLLKVNKVTVIFSKLIMLHGFKWWYSQFCDSQVERRARLFKIEHLPYAEKFV